MPRIFLKERRRKEIFIEKNGRKGMERRKNVLINFTLTVKLSKCKNHSSSFLPLSFLFFQGKIVLNLSRVGIYLAFSSKIFFKSKSISSSLVQNTVKNDSRDRHGFIKNFFIPIPNETF